MVQIILLSKKENEGKKYIGKFISVKFSVLSKWQNWDCLCKITYPLCIGNIWSQASLSERFLLKVRSGGWQIFSISFYLHYLYDSMHYLLQPPKELSEIELISPVTSPVHFSHSTLVFCNCLISFLKGHLHNISIYLHS